MQSLLARMLDIILREVTGEEEEYGEVAATPRAMALMTTQKKSAVDEEAASNSQSSGGGSTAPCKIWPWDMGMGFGPNSGLRVRC